MAAVVAEHEIAPPAVVVVGPVAALGDGLAPAVTGLDTAAPPSGGGTGRGRTEGTGQMARSRSKKLR